MSLVNDTVPTILGFITVMILSYVIGSIPAVQRAIVRFSEWGITDDE